MDLAIFSIFQFSYLYYFSTEKYKTFIKLIISIFLYINIYNLFTFKKIEIRILIIKLDIFIEYIEKFDIFNKIENNISKVQYLIINTIE